MSPRYRVVPVVSCARDLVVLLGILSAALLALSFQAKPAEALATCAGSLQAKIDAAPSGGTVTADPCVYREQITIKKPITLQGQPGSEIRGSDVWSKFSLKGGVYVSANVLPAFSANGQCKPGTYECLKPEQVFLDGKPLKQVANGTIPATGQFSLDSGRHVIIKDNPSGKLVEVSVRRQWVRGGASGVTIKGFKMKHAANDSQYRAALSNNNYPNWTLQGNVLSDSHGALVGFGEASGLKILNNELFRGGQLGVHSTGASITISGNKIHDNNTSGFDPSWEAGGVKAMGTNSILAENNQVWNNQGRGLWCDIGCSNAVFRGNTVHHNDYGGIFFEISTGAKIYNNKVYENGWDKTGRAVGSWEAGIQVYNSRNAEVYNNTVAWNRSGIAVVRVDRRDGNGEDVYGNNVHDNQVFSKDYPSSLNYDSAARNHALAWVDGMADKKLYDPAKNNRGYSNDYYFVTSENPLIPRFKWDDGVTLLPSFNLMRGEELGRYLSQSEKDAIVANRGIPANPEH